MPCFAYKKQSSVLLFLTIFNVQSSQGWIQQVEQTEEYLTSIRAAPGINWAEARGLLGSTPL